MKKIIYSFIFLFLMVGCANLSNTPIKKTEEFLKKYQTLDDEVISDLNNSISDSFTFEQKEEYLKIMKNHYQNMVYEIKDDEIDGNEAKVTVEITVTDLRKAIDETDSFLMENPSYFMNDKKEYDVIKYNTYRIQKLGEARDKIKYTIIINLSKINNMWTITDVSQEVIDKINGIYNY